MKIRKLESAEVVTGPHGEITVQRVFASGGTCEDTFDDLTVEALRKHFQQERDEEMGRWRDPEETDMVCYLAKEDSVYVFNERTGNRAFYWLRDSLLARLWLEGAERDSYNTARRYFAAHPEPKPWHDAAPGEVWVITVDGTRHVSQVLNTDKFLPNQHTSGWQPAAYDVTDPLITNAYRVWPEGGN